MDNNMNIPDDVSKYINALITMKQYINSDIYGSHASLQKHQYQRTPIHWALAGNASVDLIKVLLERGSDPKIQDKVSLAFVVCIRIEKVFSNEVLYFIIE